MVMSVEESDWRSKYSSSNRLYAVLTVTKTAPILEAATCVMTHWG